MRGKNKSARLNVTQAMLFVTIVALIPSALMMVFPEETARMLGSSEHLLPMVADYLLWFVPSWVFQIWITVSLFVIRLDGAPKLAMLCSLITAVINVVLDWLFIFPFGWGELWGIADRTDYDLTRHQETSGQDMSYFDDTKGEKYIPYVVEPSLGADRVTLAFLCAAYEEENIGTEEAPDIRNVMHFHPALAPVKVGVLPLSKKLGEGAEKIYADLSKYWNCEYDDRGNIGKRYRRQDEIGTPFCVTYDFDSETDGCVTVRDRDSMEQERVKIDELRAYLEEKLAF